MAQKQFVHRNLTSDSVVLSRHRLHWPKWILIILLMLGLGAGAGFYVNNTDVDWSALASRMGNDNETEQLRTELLTLRGQVNKAKLDSEVDRATRQELERQIAVLRDDLKKAREEVEFMKTAGGRSAAKP